MSLKGNFKAAGTDSGRKMAVTNVCCYKCNSSVDVRDTVLCSACNNRFHFDCAGLSEKLYRLKDEDSKKKWKCKTCASSKKCNKLPTGRSNVTLRKPQKQKQKQVQKQNLIQNITPKASNSASRSTFMDFSENTSSTPKIQRLVNLPLQISPTSTFSPSSSRDDTLIELKSPSDSLSPTGLPYNAHHSRSCPDLSTSIHVCDELERAKVHSSMLQEKLDVAENEIAILVSENCDLKLSIDKYKRKISTLLSICASVPKECGRNVAKGNYSTFKEKTINKINTNVTKRSLQEQSCLLDGSEHEFADLFSYEEKMKLLEERICMLQFDLTEAYEKIDSLKFELSAWKCSTAQISDSRLRLSEKKADRDSSARPVDHRPKICLISSSTKDIMLMAERYFNSSFCHYKITNGGIIQLIENIEHKLSNFTLSDYCIIFVGSQDFETTSDYAKLVEYIRVTLGKVQHTNVILCLPTFMYSDRATLFNKRIDDFNGKLYRDNLEYEYAFIIDTNKCLVNSYAMYSGVNFQINRRGIISIFRCIRELVVNISKNIGMKTESINFFREL